MLLAKNIELSPVTAYTVRQAAELLGVSVMTIHNYIDKGKRINNDHRYFLIKEKGYIGKENLIKFIRYTRPDK
jgi:predicted site-specific integrase-resolvase